MAHPIPVFYRKEQSSEAAVSYSPSAAKPAKVVADWRARPEIAEHIQIKTFKPADNDTLCAVHDPAYVEGILSGMIANGFGNRSLELAKSLRYTVGSTVAACRHVLTAAGQPGFRIAVSPTSGFHHAGYDFGGGYCTFNGLVAAAVRMKALGLVRRVLIADFDAHNGNGTENILAKLGLDWITHITAGKSYRAAEQALVCADLLHNPDMDNIDLVIFQAGADIHIDDPLGGLLTTEQMCQRDQQVFAGCARHEVPVVFNLAGGYQRDKNGTIEPVLALHRQTIQQAIMATQGKVNGDAARY